MVRNLFGVLPNNDALSDQTKQNINVQKKTNKKTPKGFLKKGIS